MAAGKRPTGQDPQAHVFYDVDWTDWLTARGFLANGSEITSAPFTVAAPATLSFEVLNGAVARVYIKDVPLNGSIEVISTINMPEPDPGAGLVTDQVTFTIKGKQK